MLGRYLPYKDVRIEDSDPPDCGDLQDGPRLLKTLDSASPRRTPTVGVACAIFKSHVSSDALMHLQPDA